MLLLLRMLDPSSGALFPAALIFKPPDPDPNTSVSGTWVPCDSGRKWAGRMIVMQQIDQVSQDTAILSICRNCTHRGVRVCVGFLHGQGHD